MLKTVLAGALASGALAAGSAQAHDFNYPYGYDNGVPPYAAGGHYGGGGYGGYAPYQRRNFTLLGARAGVTVLGVDLDASAKLTVGASGWGHGRGYAPPAYAPPPPPPESYAPPPPPMSYAPPMYSYGYQGPVSYGYSYGYGACGC